MLFANLLPGFRELRAPLAAGYVFLAVLCAFGIGEIPTESDAEGLAATLYAVKDVLGAAGLAAAITFVAYVIGSVVADVAAAIYRVASRLVAKQGRYEDLPDGTWVEHPERRPLELTRRGSKALGQLAKRAWDDALNETRSVHDVARNAQFALGSTPEAAEIARLLDIREPDDYVMSRAVRLALAHQTAEELGLVWTRLLGREPELHGAVDRLRSEAELRLALVVSSFLAFVYFYSDGPWWAAVAAASLLPVLTGQAVIRRRAAGDQLTDALLLQRVQAPTLERFLELNGIRSPDSPPSDSSAPDDPKRVVAAS